MDDQNTSPTLTNSSNKYGNTEQRQERINAIAAVALRKDEANADLHIREYLDFLNGFKQDKMWLLRGMSEQREYWLQSLEEDIDWYELKVKLYRMIKEKLRGT